MIKSTVFLAGEIVDLSNEIALLSPTDTPLYTMVAGRGQIVEAKDITVTWREKTLNADRSNPSLEGSNAGTPIASSRSLKSNICQIVEKVTSVSGTARALAAQGIGDEFQREVADRLLELKRDAEWYFLQGTKALESGATPRQMDGLLNLVANVEDLTETATLTEDALLNVLQDIWSFGADGDMVAYLNASEKRILNNILKNGTNVRLLAETGSNAYGVKVDRFESDFGTINFVLDRHMPSGDILVVDLSVVEIANLRAPFYEDLAKTGDFSQGHVVSEQTIKLLNTKAGGKITGFTK